MKKYRLLAILNTVLLVTSLFLMNACSKQEQPAEQKLEMPAVEAPPGEAEQGAGAVTAEDVKQQTEEALEAAKAYTIEQKEEYQKKAEVKLDELKAKIAELETKAKESEPEVKAKLDAQVAELKKKNEDALKKLDELKKAGEDAWAVLKADLDQALDDLDKFVKDLLPETK